MAQPENSVDWKTASTIWWQMFWRFVAGSLLQWGLDWVFDSSWLLWPADTFLDIWIWQWAIREAFRDRYERFRLEAVNSKTFQSVLGGSGRVSLWTAFRIWWALTWRTGIVPSAIFVGAFLVAILKHQGPLEFIGALYSQQAEYFTMAVMVPVSFWATREILMHRFRSFRFVITPKS